MVGDYYIAVLLYYLFPIFIQIILLLFHFFPLLSILWLICCDFQLFRLLLCLFGASFVQWDIGILFLIEIR